MRAIRSAALCVALLVAPTAVVSAEAGDDAASRPPVPSPGCGSSTFEAGQHPDNQLQVNDLERSWVMHVPQAHDGVTPVPLWLHFHGVGRWASTVDAQAVAEDEGFVVVAPQGIRTQQGYPRGWMWDDEDAAIDLTTANPDIALVDALIDEVGAELCIDLARVYAAGLSGGGDAASVLSCALDERIAAVAPVAGPLGLGAACAPDRAVPYLSVFGTSDGWFEGLAEGEPWGEHPIPQALASEHHLTRTSAVAVQHGCGRDPVFAVEVDGVEQLAWSCPPETDVELIVIKGGGHAWQPDSGPASRWYDTSEAVWEFFERHPLPE